MRIDPHMGRQPTDRPLTRQRQEAEKLDRRLGRGLGSLLGADPVQEEASGHSEIGIEEIRPNRHQPRRVFDSVGLEELRDSIQIHGVLQAIVVRRSGESYELIAGERRWRAARLAGLSTIPAVVRDNVTDDEMLELALVENVQRRDLDALEKARGYRQMADTLNLTQEQVGEKVGLKRATIANHLRLLDLPQEAQEALSENLITMGHARALLGLSDPDEIKEFLGRIVRGGLSVRQAENSIRAKTQSGSDGEETAERGGDVVEPEVELQPVSPWVTELQRRMQIHLGTKVTLANREGYKGKIVVEYYNREDLERLVEVLAPREEL